MSDTKTEFHVRVVRLSEISRHPNADTLSITQIDGYPVIFKTGQFATGGLAVYVPVDALVPTDRPEFVFLAKNGEGPGRHRVRAMRLRGVFSMGLLVPVPYAECEVDDDLADYLRVTKYMPPSELRLTSQMPRGAARAMRDPGFMPVYGLDAIRKTGTHALTDERVVITEKIHGTNARFCYRGGRLWVGSHKVMRGRTPHRLLLALTQAKLKLFDVLGIKHRAHILNTAGDVWWECVKQYDLERKLATVPGYVVYGEIYGQGVQDLTYDSPIGRKFRVFDVLDTKTGRYLDHEALVGFAHSLGLATVPVLYCGTFAEGLLSLAEGKSTLAPHVREGIVIRPLREKFDRTTGRVALKHVGEGYYLRNEATS